MTPQGTWPIWLALAGRGWGKTRTGAEDAGWYATQHPGAQQPNRGMQTNRTLQTNCSIHTSPRAQHNQLAMARTSPQGNRGGHR